MIKTIGFVFLVVCLCFSMVHGQDKKFEIRVGAGVAPTLGSKDFKDLYALAFHGGGDFAYWVGPQITFGGNFHYGRFSIDEGAFLGGQSGSVDGGALSGFEILGMLRYYVKPPAEAGSARFYILGGLGMASYKQSDITVRSGNSTFNFSSDRQSDLMLSLGSGSKFGASSSVNFFVEITLSIVFSDPDNATYLPLRAGIVF